MKRIVVLVFCLFSLVTQAENLDPIKWSFALSSKEIHVGDTVEIVATAAIIPDWYLYSNDFDPNLGPTITEFKFTADNGYKLLGKTKAIKPKKKYDPIWEGDVTYFVDHAEFRQKIIILNDAPKIMLSVNFQTCTEGRCVPGEIEFEFVGLTILPERKTKKSTAVPPKKYISMGPWQDGSNKPETIESLEAEKSKLIQRDVKGNDVSMDYLKGFVKKYSK